MRSTMRCSASNASWPAPYLGSKFSESRTQLSQHRLRDRARLAHAQRGQLHLAGAVDQPHQAQALRQRAAHRHRPVVAQQQHRLVAGAREDARALVGVHGDALELVVRHLAEQLRGVEVGVGQAFVEAAHGHGRRGVHVHHAVRVGHLLVDLAVEGEAGRVDRPVAVADDVALHVHLHQVRRAHLAVVQAEGVDQEVRLGARHAQRDVVVDQLAPAQVIEDAVGRGEPDAGVPLLGRVAARARGGGSGKRRCRS